MSTRGNLINWNLLFMDLAVLFLCFFLTNQLLILYSVHLPWSSLKIILLTITPLIIVFFSLFDVYTHLQRENIQNLLYSIVLSMILIYGGFLTFSLLKPISAGHHIFIPTLLMMESIILVAVRTGVWMVWKKERGERKVIIIGENQEAILRLSEKVNNHTKGWFELVGIYLADNKAEIRNSIDRCDLVVLSTAIQKDIQEEIASSCLRRGKEVLVVPQFMDLTLQCGAIQQIDDMLVFSLSPLEFSMKERAIKRTFDIVFSSFFIILLSPLFLLFYFLIPLTSKGSAIFTQERIGLNGNPFLIYKFRSMIQDAEMATGPILASEGDPRVTAIGKFMRAVRLDEIPQLLNVLKGDMSLVGPRPEREYFITKFNEQIPNYTTRLNVKPGITGLAQVAGNYSTGVEEKLQFDFLYIQNYSLLLDVKILLQTVRVMVQPKQAKGIKDENKKKEVSLKEVKKKSKVLSR